MPDAGGGTDAQLAAGIYHAVSHGAAVLNMSVGGYQRSETLAKSIEQAALAERVVVAAAGNDNASQRSYPAGFDTLERFQSWFGLAERQYYVPVLAVAALDSSDRRAGFSNFGDWVDVSAPGVGIVSTVPLNSSANLPANRGLNPYCLDTDRYCAVNGTSQASPIVAGAAALLKSDQPSSTETEVRIRIWTTAHPLPDPGLGGGRLDIFEAIFNAGFESGGFRLWQSSGTATVVPAVGPIVPPDGSRRMADVSTGPGAANVSSTLTKTFRVLSGDEDLELSFRYNYVTEEYPEFVGTQFNDDLEISLRLPSGNVIPIASESVNTTGWTPISGINFPGGDSTVGQSNWKTADLTVPISQLGGATTFQLVIRDVGDAIFDSIALVDAFSLR